ncbi:MAG TPA: hypothetical protein VIK55_04570 [Paludibacter sp.]
MYTKIYYLRVCATASKKKEWKYMPGVPPDSYRGYRETPAPARLYRVGK